MLPAFTDAYCVWLHRLRPLFVQCRQRARAVVAACVVWLFLVGGWDKSRAAGLQAETPADFLSLEQQSAPSASSDPPDSANNGVSSGLIIPVDHTTDLTTATDRPRRWGQPDRRQSWLRGHLRLVADDADERIKPPSEPDIKEPGPDMGDYPNSAFTLPQGRAYVEFAPLTLQTANAANSAAYSFPFLLRYGLTDDVEFRLIGSGLSSVFNTGNTVSGFAPLIVDTKIHLWDDRMEQYLPAASLEVYIQTNLASPGFQVGVEPSLNLNLDFPLSEKTNIEMTLGYTGVQDSVRVHTGQRYDPILGYEVPVVHREDVTFNEFSFQWAVERQLTDEFQVFVHGYYNGSIFLQSGPSKVIGAGWFYQVSKQIMLFSSYNFGLDSASPPFSTQLGMAFAL